MEFKSIGLPEEKIREPEHLQIDNLTADACLGKDILQGTHKQYPRKTRPLKKQLTLQYIVLLCTFIVMVCAGFIVYELHPEFYRLNADRLKTSWGFYFLFVTALLLATRFSFFIYNIYLYLSYKVIKSVPDKELPNCTVIVPAYNEGKLVLATLQSLARSHYPESKLQILAIDDGSRDNTWQWMMEAKKQLGNRISIYQQPENKGKRHALYRGFKLATGDVIVTVDSDSVVKPNTLRNLVSPFVTDANCGAVAGNVQVLNNKKAILPKMLNVSFVLSFEFMRSAESALGTVMCTPGALSAYRREAVFACLDEWINQTFMGKPSDIGEDRAMTNMILKQGYSVLFQRNARVLTNVPERYNELYKMFIRWDRSNVRENIMMAKYVFSNFREKSKAGARILFLNQSLKLITAYPMAIIMLAFAVTHPVLFLSSTLFSILFMSSFSVFFYSRRYNFSQSLWAYTYSILYTFGLFWITPYAIVTAGKRGWLTRTIPQE